MLHPSWTCSDIPEIMRLVALMKSAPYFPFHDFGRFAHAVELRRRQPLTKSTPELSLAQSPFAAVTISARKHDVANSVRAARCQRLQVIDLEIPAD